MMVRQGLLALSVLVLLIAAGAIFRHRRHCRPPIPSPLQPSISSSTGPPRSWPTAHSIDVKALPPREALPPGTLRILVVGDSVASFLGVAMRYRQEEAQSFVAVRGVGNCSIFESKPYLSNGKEVMSSSCSMNWVKDVEELHPDVTLIIMGGGYFDETACTDTFRVAYEQRVFELAGAMGKDAGRIVITRVPYPIKGWRHSNVPARVDCFNTLLMDIARKGSFDTLDLMRHVCPTPECRVESNEEPIRPDGLHFDGPGAEDTAGWVLGELRRLGRLTNPP